MSYLSLNNIVTLPFMALSCIIFEIKQDVGRKSRFFHTPPAFNAPVRRSRLKIAIKFVAERLER